MERNLCTVPAQSFASRSALSRRELIPVSEFNVSTRVLNLPTLPLYQPLVGHTTVISLTNRRHTSDICTLRQFVLKLGFRIKDWTARGA